MKLFIVLLTGAFMLATGTSDVFAKKKEKVQTEAKSDTVQTVSKKGILNIHVCLRTKEW